MTPAPVKPPVAMDLLSQLDIRVGTIDSVADVAGSEKLVALRVDFGDHKRTIVAGLRQERADPRRLKVARRCSSSTWNRERYAV